VRTSSRGVEEEERMATDLTVVLEDRPGTLAELGEVLGSGGVNIEGLCGSTSGGEGLIHVLVEEAAGARAVLDDAGIEVRDEREVVVIDCPDEPGALGERARGAADADVNIDLVYLASRTRLVMGSDDLDGLRDALGS
jgi:hypothetical protein